MNIKWDRLTANQDFTKTNFEQLKRIFLNLDSISGIKLNRIWRVLSKNQSIRWNLEEIFFRMVEVNGEDFLFNLLKIKSYGFEKCKILELKNSIDFEYNFFSLWIDLSSSKITRSEKVYILFLLYLNFAKSKSLSSCMRYIQWLEYFEYEEEEYRDQSFSYNFIKSFTSQLQNNYISEDTENNLRFWSSELRDYIYSNFSSEQGKIFNADFPRLLVKSPMIKLYIQREIYTYIYVPFIELKSLFIDTFLYSLNLYPFLAKHAETQI